MGTLPEPSNEQKLTYIYKVMKAQETRRKRKIFMGVMKFILFISLLIYIYAYRYQVIDRSYKFVADSINDRVKKISEKQKSDILKGIQQLLPPSLEETLKDVQKVIQSGTGDLIPPLNKSTTTKTTTNTPAKK